ncbi:hypothetical protein L596_006253 [Steinernema carpocapsae]|uniref:Uncharacterized protein n=1 Tax=Steinernema carpocapsae TaxID=34508 RepID=A0A4V6YSZ8_STECR|nr:hypothetical protein L596_006253 [Steinernema carpocapsae]
MLSCPCSQAVPAPLFASYLLRRPLRSFSSPNSARPSVTVQRRTMRSTNRGAGLLGPRSKPGNYERVRWAEGATYV